MRLAPLYQEAIYPDLHTQVKNVIGKGPDIAIKLIAAFLGLQTRENVKRVYLIVDGLINIVQSGQRDKPS